MGVCDAVGIARRPLRLLLIGGPARGLRSRADLSDLFDWGPVSLRSTWPPSPQLDAPEHGHHAAEDLDALGVLLGQQRRVLGHEHDLVALLAEALDSGLFAVDQGGHD